MALLSPGLADIMQQCSRVEALPRIASRAVRFPRCGFVAPPGGIQPIVEFERQGGRVTRMRTRRTEGICRALPGPRGDLEVLPALWQSGPPDIPERLRAS